MAAVGHSKPMCGVEIVTTNTSFSDLNDGCLKEICEYLDLADLCVFTKVCNRFRKNAQTHFASTAYTVITEMEWGKLTARAKCSLLRNFGYMISSLAALSSRDNDDELIEMIIRYCDEAIDTLKLRCFTIDKENGQKMRPILVRLRMLAIIDCDCADSFFDMGTS